ncbi:unnamed protein product, partial [marine sediment metagenome]
AVDQILSGGRMLAGGKLQDIMEVSTTQNYDLGTRLMIDDRVYRYAKAAENLGAMWGAFCDPQLYWEGNGDMPLADAGDKIISFDNKNAEPILVDELKDGWVVGVGLPADFHSMYCMKIKSNKASSGDGGAAPATCEITLYRGMPHGIVGAGHRSYVYPGLYANVKQSGGASYGANYGAVVCVPPRKILADEYFWGQTWGVFYCMNSAYATAMGAIANNRTLGFDGDGRCVYRTAATADAFWQQAG